jgi:hypothetical protein
MPDHEELEILLDANGERSISEFPDDSAWDALKAEIMSQTDGGGNGENR